MTTETKILKDETIEDLAWENRMENSRAEIQAEAFFFARAIEQAVLQSIANDPNRINAAAKALSRHMDYPWEFMTVEGRDNMRRAAMITINAAMEKQP